MLYAARYTGSECFFNERVALATRYDYTALLAQISALCRGKRMKQKTHNSYI